MTLIESLIALLVLAIALLGVASLQLLAQREEIDARWRSQAVNFSGTLLEQLRTDRVAAAKLSIHDNVLDGCDSTNQWLCTLVEEWQARVEAGFPYAWVQLQLDESDAGLTMATTSIVWQRMASDTSPKECRPQDGDAALIADGGCIRLETAL